VSSLIRFPSHSLLDHFLTFSSDANTVSTLVSLGTSDLAATCCNRTVALNKKINYEKIVRGLLNKTNWDELQHFNANNNWTSGEDEDVEVYAEKVSFFIQLAWIYIFQLRLFHS
jgi:hypothetical protein